MLLERQRWQCPRLPNQPLSQRQLVHPHQQRSPAGIRLPLQTLWGAANQVRKPVNTTITSQDQQSEEATMLSITMICLERNPRLSLPSTRADREVSLDSNNLCAQQITVAANSLKKVLEKCYLLLTKIPGAPP